MMSDYLLVYCTCPDTVVAEGIAETLVAERLAACVNIVPGLTSVYRWQGAVERAAEGLLLIKTTTGRYPVLEERLRALHPYELPEIVAVSLVRGLPAYLDWLNESVSP
jgi:periplasmic divalent cation tolerance protein